MDIIIYTLVVTHITIVCVKLSRRWFEFDIGWMWLSLFKLAGLAKLTR